MQFISVVAKLHFQQSLLQSSVLHDPSEIILICWFRAQDFFFIINVENICAAIFKNPMLLMGSVVLFWLI